MDMKVRVGFWLVFLFMAQVFGAAARSGVARRNLEVRRHLSRVNKPSVKSIKMRPSYHPEGLFSQQESGQERDRAKANNSAVAYEWEMPRGNSSHKKNQRRGYAESELHQGIWEENP
ncbi:hypothetical protein Sango_0172000 [Sesamum angolense]|uniref:Uncharacterized protein n=1 Tax=Sesamum angolense TaxID=2727404 RepID=A0AAE2C700_9LAMI|nr:hypothetical protein Sango_0172000 [Sesamum angolense]